MDNSNGEVLGLLHGDLAIIGKNLEPRDTYGNCSHSVLRLLAVARFFRASFVARGVVAYDT